MTRFSHISSFLEHNSFLRKRVHDYILNLVWKESEYNFNIPLQRIFGAIMFKALQDIGAEYNPPKIGELVMATVKIQTVQEISDDMIFKPGM